MGWNFWKSKAFWASIALAATAIGGYANGDLSFIAMLMAVLAAFGGIGLRHGVAKKG